MERITKILLLMLLVACFASNAQTVDDLDSSLAIDPKTNCHIRYYYYTNLQAYYDNLKSVYYYRKNGNWESAEELPLNLGGYSLYNKNRVAITDYEEDKPYLFFDYHKKMFPYNSKGRFLKDTASKE